MPFTKSGAKALVGGRALAAWGFVALLLVAAAAFAAHRLALRAGQEDLRDEARHRLDVVASSLDSQLARFEFLPSLLEVTPNVLKLLDSPLDPALRDEVNRYLSGINATAGAEMLYVLDRSGMALAAADWDQPGTTVGSDYAFRPYVKEALAQGRGRFYGVGITSRRPGYYLSYALSAGGKKLGIATVKVSLVDTEQSWRKLPGAELLTDERGVVILSTQEQWKFRPLTALGAEALADIAASRPYGDAALEPLDWRETGRLAQDVKVVRLDGVEMLASMRPVNAGRWQLVALDELAPVRDSARNLAITAALASCVVLLLMLVGYQRRLGRKAMHANQVALQAAHDSLESRVAQRTSELRKAQADLVHAEKMSALGQMSAGLVHELNQPLAAMRTLSDNACVLLDSNREDEARGNLLRIARLVDRLARLTRQLKLFARKPSEPSGSAAPVALKAVIASALSLHADRLRENDVQVRTRVEPPSLKAVADEAQLEQVFVNLIGNAIDAVCKAPLRQVTIDAVERDGRCRVTVRDTGPGIRDDILPRVFEPFVTSKAPGAGLGLGLSISANIVRDFHGSLTGWNMEEGGACFAIDLEMAASMEHAAHA